MKKRLKRIYIEITNVCNLKCHFCSMDTRERKFLSLAEFEFMVQQIDPFCDYLYLHIKGEPLMHPQLIEILDLCHKHQKYVQLVSNASFLMNYGARLKTHPALRKLSLSLHSIEEQKEVDRYIEGILTFLKLPVSHINIELRFWNKNAIMKSTHSLTMIHLLAKQYNIAFMELLAGSINIKLAQNLYLNFDQPFIWPSYENVTFSKKGTCYGTRTMLGILVDGTIVPCCLDSKGSINLGNIFQNQFGEILKNPRLLDMKRGFENEQLIEQLCQKCGYRRRF